ILHRRVRIRLALRAPVPLVALHMLDQERAELMNQPVEPLVSRVPDLDPNPPIRWEPTRLQALPIRTAACHQRPDLLARPRVHKNLPAHVNILARPLSSAPHTFSSPPQSAGHARHRPPVLRHKLLAGAGPRCTRWRSAAWTRSAPVQPS